MEGIVPVNGGDALIYDESLTAPGGMDRIRSYMGVCPQFDVLWDELTGREHLEIYGQVKGLSAQQSRREARELLHSVKLEESASVTAGSYSGGMKRRLSVAIALLGNPKIVFLDEPTTGMDPINRRHVWDIIEAAKKGRAIILTTHSMEEADILGDRIAIMARGSIRCIGSSLRLKSKFGAGYCISVNISPMSASASSASLAKGCAARVKEFFMSNIGLEPSDETKAYVQFLVPKSKEGDLPGFLELLKESSQELGVTDLHVALTSLEEVFLSIARQAELEDNPDKVEHAELPDGSLLLVPLGVERVQHPATGVTYAVKWGQDESGNLQILHTQPLEAAATPA
jgi:ABC-type multidrug transport system ATPase subunit